MGSTVSNRNLTADYVRQRKKQRRNVFLIIGGSAFLVLLGILATLGGLYWRYHRNKKNVTFTRSDVIETQPGDHVEGSEFSTEARTYDDGGTPNENRNAPPELVHRSKVSEVKLDVPKKVNSAFQKLFTTSTSPVTNPHITEFNKQLKILAKNPLNASELEPLTEKLLQINEEEEFNRKNKEFIPLVNSKRKKDNEYYNLDGKLTKAQENVEFYSNELKREKDRKKSLRKQLNSATEANKASYQQQLDTAENNVKSFENSLKENKAEIQKLKSERSKTLEELKAMTNQLYDKYRGLLQQMSVGNSEVLQLQNVLHDVDRAIVEAENLEEQRKRDYDSKKGLLKNNDKDPTKGREIVDSYRKDYEQAHKSKESLLTAKQKVEEAIDKLENQVKSMRNRITDSFADNVLDDLDVIPDTSVAVKDYASQLQELKRKQSSLDHDKVAAMLQEKALETILKDQSNRLQYKADEISNRTSFYTEQLKNLQNELDRSHQQLKLVEKDVGTLSPENRKELNERSAAIRQKIKDFESQIAKFRDELSTAQAQEKSNNDMLSHVKGVIAEREIYGKGLVRQKSVENLHKELSAELDKARLDMYVMDEYNNGKIFDDISIEELQELRDKMISKERSLDNADRKIKEKINAFQVSLEQTKERMEDYKKEYLSLEKLVQELNTKKEQINAAINEAKPDEVGQKRLELNKLEDELTAKIRNRDTAQLLVKRYEDEQKVEAENLEKAKDLRRNFMNLKSFITGNNDENAKEGCQKYLNDTDLSAMAEVRDTVKGFLDEKPFPVSMDETKAQLLQEVESKIEDMRNSKKVDSESREKLTTEVQRSYRNLNEISVKIREAREAIKDDLPSDEVTKKNKEIGTLMIEQDRLRGVASSQEKKLEKVEDRIKTHRANIDRYERFRSVLPNYIDKRLNATGNMSLPYAYDYAREIEQKIKNDRAYLRRMEGEIDLLENKKLTAHPLFNTDLFKDENGEYLSLDNMIKLKETLKERDAQFKKLHDDLQNEIQKHDPSHEDFGNLYGIEAAVRILEEKFIPTDRFEEDKQIIHDNADASQAERDWAEEADAHKTKALDYNKELGPLVDKTKQMSVSYDILSAEMNRLAEAL